MGFTDDRGCAPCACGASDSGCSGTLDVYEKDGTCFPKALSFTLALSSAKASCVDLIPPGSPLASKEIPHPDYQAGTCAPQGGEVTGAANPSGASTLCCLMLS